MDRPVVDVDDNPDGVAAAAADTAAVAAVREVRVGILLLPMSGDDPDREEEDAVDDVVERGV